MLKRAGFTVPQHDGGDEPLRCDIRGLRVSGQGDDSLSWVVGKKTRAEHLRWRSEETRQGLLLRGC
jgi:hypothetical protein